MYQCLYEESCLYTHDKVEVVLAHVRAAHGIHTHLNTYVQMQDTAHWLVMSTVESAYDVPGPWIPASWACPHCQTACTMATCTFTRNHCDEETCAITG
jgi:hypothetical protein